MIRLSTFAIATGTLIASACATGPSAAPVAQFNDCTTAQARAAADETYPQSTEDYLQLVSCLGHPDPAVRDGFAYERFVDALRNRTPDADTRRAVGSLLGEILAADGNATDPGFEKPFAVLVLAEVARTDRIDPYLSPEERSALVKTGADYLSSVRDYRGFSEDEGWRHGVAHAADLMLQLSLNENISADDAAQMLAAIRSQILPANYHHYIYGEARRLARPVLFLAMGGHLSDQEWASWFETFKPDESDPAWQSPYMSRAGLANLHNTRQFMNAVYVWSSESEDEKLVPMRDGARGVLRSLP